MLDRFRKAQQPAVDRLLALDAVGQLPAPYTGIRPPFAASLLTKGPGAVIAEYKRASPSQGEINLGREPEEIARLYAEAGAGALSVLTEETYFKGDIGYLWRMREPGLPLLRKDFLIHPLQITETAATPASALLLIARMLPDADLVHMLRAAAEAGLEAIIEVFDEADLEKTRSVLAKEPVRPVIIQVNNRDLQKLTVSDGSSRRLIREKSGGEFWISASGVETRERVEELASMGFDAVLVGTSLMRQANPGAALRILTTGNSRADEGKVQ